MNPAFQENNVGECDEEYFFYVESWDQVDEDDLEDEDFEENEGYSFETTQVEEEKDPREVERDWFRQYDFEFPEGDYSQDAELMKLYQEIIDRAVDAYEDRINNPPEY